jgi:hypothetical protein
MCIIVIKERNIPFPTIKTLKECFSNNPDGAGFMYAVDGGVHIEKGFMSFKSFKEGLFAVRKIYGDNIPYVLHFRISTQGGVLKEYTHPYPLSDDMDDLRKLSFTTKIGIAHNGVISLTSSYLEKNYNDTMKFISQYLSLIIRDKKYFKDNKTMMLIERLIGSSRLALLDNSGTVVKIGAGWVTDNGVHYSNDTYKNYIYKFDNLYAGYNGFNGYDNYRGYTPNAPIVVDNEKLYEEDLAYYEYFYNDNTQEYDFEQYPICPKGEIGSSSWCSQCANREHCLNKFKK